MSYTVTKSRITQWLGIILILAVFAGAYWYFQVYGSTLNAPQNDLNTNGLVGLWSFNGDDISGATATDRGTGGNNGTLTNAPARVEGKISQALNFFPNGSDTNAYVTMGDPGDGDLDFGSGDFSVGFWMKGSGYTAQGSSVNIALSKKNNDAPNTAGYTFRYASDNLMRFTMGDGSADYEIAASRATTNDNQWHHYLGIRSGSTLYLYIDDALIGSIAVSGSSSNTVSFTVGGDTIDVRNVNGSMDEIRAYNRALSAGEIQSLYAAGGGTKIDSAISQPQGTGRLDSGLAGYWALDDGSGTSATDSSTNGDTGTLINGPTWTTGQIGSAVSFDGVDDYIDTDNGSSMDNLTQLTHAMWIYPTSDNGFLIAKRNSGGGHDGFRLTSGTLQGWISNFVADSVARSTSSTTVSLNVWSHVAMTYSHAGDKKVRLYINGSEVAYSEQDTNPSGTDTDTGFDFYVGTSQLSGTPFTGSIDEVRIYNRALSADEVRQLSRLTAPTSVDTGLKGYWSFNGKDMSGTTAYDRSGAGNTGTLTGGPAIAEGKLAQGLNFDGTDDYVSVADTAAFTQSALTVSFWKKNTSVASNSSFLTKSSGSNRSWSVQTLDAGRNIQFITSSSSVSESEYGVTPNGVMAVNQWHHVVCVFNGAGSTNAERMQIYINGIAQPITFTGTIPATLVNNTQAVTIGGKGGVAGFLGFMDEVRIYNRALSAGEAKGLYDVGADDKTNSAVSQPQGTGRLDSGLAGYWPLDNGSGTSATDASTNGNTGTLTNGPTWTTGQVGGAVTFDGTNDYVVTTNATNLNAYPISVSTWVKTSVNDASRRPIVSKYSYLNGYALFMRSGKVYAWYMGNSSNYVYDGADGMVSTTTVSDDAWHNVVLTIDIAGGKLFVDGKLEASRAWTGTPQASTTTNGLGLSYPDGGSFMSYLAASIDDTRVYNRALSADEVAQLYRLNAPTGTDTGLKGYWSFNGKDMSGTSAYDRSGAGNTGTLTSGPTIVEGKIGQGLSFDGTDDYVTGNIANVPMGNTMSLWFRANNVTGNKVLFSHDDNTNTGQRLNLLGSGSSLYFTLGGVADYDCGLSAVVANTWYFFAATTTGDGGTVTCYLGQTNGTFTAGSSVAIGTRTGTPTKFNIGARNGGNNLFSGTIDETRIYNRALTEAEIKSLYNTSR